MLKPTSRLQAPSDLITSYTRTAPVDVRGLAVAMGIGIAEEDLPENVSGKIAWADFFEQFYITVNRRHSSTRKRFTIAHEIAHFVLHRSLIGDGIVDDALYRSDRGEPIEREANAYAATILMPAPMVRQAWRDGLRSYSEMARRFDVSAEVARIRMKELRLS